MKYILLSWITFLNISFLYGANILVFLPLPFRSHTNAYKPLFKELALRGHNVTFYTFQPFSESIPNLKQIVIKDVMDKFVEKAVSKDFANGSGLKGISLLWSMGIHTSEALFKEHDIQELFRSTNLSFDVILLETFFIHETFTILGHKFNAPIINLHPLRAEVWINDILRNPDPLSYIPNYRLPFTDVMSFYEKILNIFYSVVLRFTGYYYYIPTQEAIMRKYVNYSGSENLPPLLELMKNTSLTLLDGNSVVSFPSPSLPNFISVGGIHLLPSKELPKDLKKFIDESPDGFIYMSFGALMKISSLPSDKLNIFLKVFSKLPQRVLMKWEMNEKMPGQPENVLTSKWFPQADILAHPKCHAFITHGGFHGVFEAVYFGVPIIGMPVFIDQESNVVMARKKGYGELIKLEDLSVEILSSLLHKVLGDASYKRNAETLSRIIRDVPMSPLETAVFWVEHVIRHKGASHLQVAGTHLPWYQYYLLDVIFTAIFILLVIILMSYKLVTEIFRFIFRILKWYINNNLNTNKIKNN